MTEPTPDIRSGGRRRAPAITPPEELGRLRWKKLRDRVPVPVAAVAFLATFFALAVWINVDGDHLERLLGLAPGPMAEGGAGDESGVTDFTLRSYLRAPVPRGVRRLAVVGASYTATGVEPDPTMRLASRLVRDLRSRTAEPWEGINLAADGYDNWSSFYIARLLRTVRPPDVLLVSIDTFGHKERNASLFLNTGRYGGRLSLAELSRVLPPNRIPLYFTEAAAVGFSREALPGFETLKRGRALLGGALSIGPGLARRLFHRTTPAHADSVTSSIPLRPRGWKETASARARIEGSIRQGPRREVVETPARHDLELLGRELSACRSSGIRVLVTTLPKNPALPRDFRIPKAYLEDWARRYGLEFHDFWTSDLVPDRYFVDSGHFFGEGCVIMADTLSALIAAGVAP